MLLKYFLPIDFDLVLISSTYLEQNLKSIFLLLKGILGQSSAIIMVKYVCLIVHWLIVNSAIKHDLSQPQNKCGYNGLCTHKTHVE